MVTRMKSKRRGHGWLTGNADSGIRTIAHSGSMTLKGADLDTEPETRQTNTWSRPSDGPEKSYSKCLGALPINLMVPQEHDIRPRVE